MTCADCIHLNGCMEQRGICSEFKTLEDIANDVKRINENFKKAAAGASSGDKAEDLSESLRRGDMDP